MIVAAFAKPQAAPIKEGKIPIGGLQPAFALVAFLLTCSLASATMHLVIVPEAQDSIAAKSPKSRLMDKSIQTADKVQPVLDVGEAKIPDNDWHSRPAGDKHSCMIVDDAQLEKILKTYPDAVYTDHKNMIIEMPDDVSFGLTTGDGDGGQISVLPSAKVLAEKKAVMDAKVKAADDEAAAANKAKTVATVKKVATGAGAAVAAVAAVVVAKKVTKKKKVV